MRAVISYTTCDFFMIRMVGIMFFTRIGYPIRITITQVLNDTGAPFANIFYALGHMLALVLYFPIDEVFNPFDAQ